MSAYHRLLFTVIGIGLVALLVLIQMGMFMQTPEMLERGAQEGPQLPSPESPNSYDPLLAPEPVDPEIRSAAPLLKPAPRPSDPDIENPWEEQIDDVSAEEPDLQPGPLGTPPDESVKLGVDLDPESTNEQPASDAGGD